MITIRSSTLHVGVAVLFALAASQAGAGEENFKLVEEVNGESTFSGHATINGRYEFFGDGELCAVDEGHVGLKLPYAVGRVRVCFSNQDEALSTLGLNSKLTLIDMKSICGLMGRASVEIEGLVTAEGPAGRWLTSKLVKVNRVSKPTPVPCNG